MTHGYLNGPSQLQGQTASGLNRARRGGLANDDTKGTQESGLEHYAPLQIILVVEAAVVRIHEVHTPSSQQALLQHRLQ